MRLGEIVLHGSSQEMITDERMRKAYLGEQLNTISELDGGEVYE